jgi:hypothetical protein
MKSKRDFIRSLGVILTIGLGGCTSSGNSGTEPQTVSESEISDEDAKERALQAESQYIRTQLEGADCLHSWDDSSTIEEQATVTQRTGEGVYVDVVSPYAISRTEDSVGDTASEATYIVRPDETERIAGDDVSPCTA